MMNHRLIGCCAAMALLAGCGTYDVKAINETQPTAGNDFTRALTGEYRDYANHEANVEYEWPHAGHFARKGLAAATGEMVAPDELALYELPANRLDELGAARTRLLGYFANGSRERVPAASAKAQVKFDCWIEEESEGEATSDCRAEFLKTEPLLKVAPPVVQAPKIVRTYTVYFDFNKADLSKISHQTLKDAAAAQAEVQPLNIYLSGHADTVGSGTYNDTLSRKRVEAVSAALAKMGVKTTILDLKAHGEKMLQVQTKDETKEPRNRRVEINFEK